MCFKVKLIFSIFKVYENKKHLNWVGRGHFKHGKCDPQSRDLTQFPSGYNFAVRPATNHPSSSCWMHTWDNVVEKNSKWFCTLFVLLCDLNPTPSASRVIALPTRDSRTSCAIRPSNPEVKNFLLQEFQNRIRLGLYKMFNLMQ